MITDTDTSSTVTLKTLIAEIRIAMVCSFVWLASFKSDLFFLTVWRS